MFSHRGITRHLLTHHELMCAALLTPTRPQPKLVNDSHLYPLPRHKTRDVEADIFKTVKPKPRVQKQDGQHLIDPADSNSRQRQILLSHLWFSVCFERQTAPSRHVLFCIKANNFRFAIFIFQKDRCHNRQSKTS